MSKRYICSEKKFNEILEKSGAWKEQNPEAAVNIWYDSETVPSRAVEATTNMLDGIDL